MLRELLLEGHRFFAAQHDGQRLEISVALQFMKILFRQQIRVSRPAEHHLPVAPAARVSGSPAHARPRALDQIGTR